MLSISRSQYHSKVRLECSEDCSLVCIHHSRVTLRNSVNHFGPAPDSIIREFQYQTPWLIFNDMRLPLDVTGLLLVAKGCYMLKLDDLCPLPQRLSPDTCQGQTIYLPSFLSVVLLKAAGLGANSYRRVLKPQMLRPPPLVSF